MRIFLTTFCFICFISIAQSQGPTPSGREPTQPQQPKANQPQQAPTANQQPTAQPPIIINIPPAQKTESEKQEEARDRQEKTQLERRLVELTGELAFFTAALFYATLALFGATVALGIFAFFQSRDSKRIGEAQTRAYVSIKHAIVHFMGEMGHPTVKFIPTNTGQSPARNFVSNVVVDYRSGKSAQFYSFDKNWQSNTGINIPSASDGPEESIGVPNMSLRTFIGILEKDIPRGIIVRIKIEYQFMDVFNLTWADQAYFAGIAPSPAPAGSGPNAIVFCKIFPMPPMLDIGKNQDAEHPYNN